MVQRETIERICADITRLPHATVEAEFDRFFGSQSPVCDFLMDQLAEASQRGRELALFMAYVAFKGMEADSGLTSRIEHDSLVDAGEEARRWLGTLHEYQWKSGSGPGASEPLGAEPYLISFVAAEIEDANGEEPGFGDDEKGAILWTLATIVTAMALATGSEENAPG